MKLWILIFSFILFNLSCQAQSIKDIESEMENAIEGKSFQLKHFYISEKQSYGDDGNLVGNTEIGTWRIFSTLEIEKIELTEHSIQLSGHRLYREFKQSGKDVENYLTSLDVLVDIAVPPPKDKTAFYKSFNRLIVSKNEELGDFISPNEIADYCKNHEAKICSAPPPDPVTTSSTALKIPQVIRISEKSLGPPLSAPKPQYPEAAKRAHASGTVVFVARISKDGIIKDLKLITSAGNGFDEASFDAVSHWKYKPYRLNGDPIEVETQITVKFEMREN